MDWGGKRPGSGRPVGSKGEIQRKQHQIRATDEEWEQIKAFAKQLKAKNNNKILDTD